MKTIAVDGGSPITAASAAIEGRLLRLVRVAPLLFLAHDLEETLNLDRMNEEVENVARRLPAPVSGWVRGLRLSLPEMGASITAFFLFETAVVAWAPRSRRGGTVLSVIAAARLVNGVQHVVQSLALRRYVPGVATAPIVTIAFPVVLLRGLRRAGAMPDSLPRTLAIGAVLIPVGALTPRLFGRLANQAR